MMNEPKGGLVGKVIEAVRYVTALKIPVYAAHTGYFIVLSVFPMLVLLLGLLRYTGLSVGALTGLLEGVIPAALLPSAKKLILSTYQNTSGMVISLSALVALWSASRGIHGLLTGLNSIYETQENRGWLHTRAVSVVYTFLFLLVLLLTLILSVFGTTIVAYLPGSPILYWVDRIVGLRFILLLAVQTALFTAMFMVLPNQRNRIGDSFPGAVFSSVGWLVFSDLYSIYVENFSGYANIFGSVYAVALSMLWLYFCLCIVFYGGALNHYLMKKKK